MSSKSSVSGRNTGFVLPHVAWQEGLFGVLYVLDSARETADDATFRLTHVFFNVLALVVDAGQLIPLLTSPTDARVFKCRQFDLFNVKCLFMLITSPFEALAGNNKIQYTIVVVLLNLVMVVALVNGIIVAHTFRTRQVNLITPIVIIRGFVRILVTVFFTSAVALLASTGSCGYVRENVRDFNCFGPEHTVVFIWSMLSLVWMIPFALAVALLYNKFVPFVYDQSAAAHGRNEVLFMATKVLVNINFIICRNATDYCRYGTVINFLCLSAVAIGSLMQAPFHVGYTNRIRLGSLFFLVLFSLDPFIPTLGGNRSLMFGMCALFAIFGYSISQVRKNQYQEKLISEMHEAHNHYSETYLSILTTIINPALADTIPKFAQQATSQDVRRGGGGGTSPRSKKKIKKKQARTTAEEAKPDPSPMALVPVRQDDALAAGAGSERGAADEYQKLEEQIQHKLASRHFVNSVSERLLFETDIELILRYFRDNWSNFSQQERDVAHMVMLETFIVMLQRSHYKAFALIWYALVSKEYFGETVSIYGYIKKAHETAGKCQLDIKYLCFFLEKEIEATRQSQSMGGDTKMNLVELMTYRKWRQAAKINHIKALQSLSRFWKVMSASDMSPAGRSKGTTNEMKILITGLRAVRAADAAYNTLIAKYPKNPSNWLLYTMFVKVALMDRARAAQMLQEKKHGDDYRGDAASSSHASGEGGTSTYVSHREEVTCNLEQRKLSGLNVLHLVSLLGCVFLLVMAGITHWVSETRMEYTYRKLQDLDHNSVMLNLWTEVCIQLNLVTIYQAANHDKYPSAYGKLLEADLILARKAEEIATSSNRIANFAQKEGMDDILLKYQEPNLRIRFFRSDQSRYHRELSFQEMVSEYVSACRKVVHDLETEGRVSLESPDLRFVSEQCAGEPTAELLTIMRMQVDHAQDALQTSINVLGACNAFIMFVSVATLVFSIYIISRGLGEYDRWASLPVVMQIAHTLTAIERRKLRKEFRRAAKEPALQAGEDDLAEVLEEWIKRDSVSRRRSTLMDADKLPQPSESAPPPPQPLQQPPPPADDGSAPPQYPSPNSSPPLPVCQEKITRRVTGFPRGPAEAEEGEEADEKDTENQGDVKEEPQGERVQQEEPEHAERQEDLSRRQSLDRATVMKAIRRASVTHMSLSDKRQSAADSPQIVVSPPLAASLSARFASFPDSASHEEVEEGVVTARIRDSPQMNSGTEKLKKKVSFHGDSPRKGLMCPPVGTIGGDMPLDFFPQDDIGAMALPVCQSSSGTSSHCILSSRQDVSPTNVGNNDVAPDDHKGREGGEARSPEITHEAILPLEPPTDTVTPGASVMDADNRDAEPPEVPRAALRLPIERAGGVAAIRKGLFNLARAKPTEAVEPVPAKDEKKGAADAGTPGSRGSMSPGRKALQYAKAVYRNSIETVSELVEEAHRMSEELRAKPGWGRAFDCVTTSCRIVWSSVAGKVSKWISLIWLGMLTWVIVRLILTLDMMSSLSDRKHIVSELKALQFHIREVAVLAPDVVERDRFPWRTLISTSGPDGAREQFWYNLHVADEEFGELVHGESTKKAGGGGIGGTSSSRKIMYEPHCFVDESCDNRTHPFPGSIDLEHGLYEGVLVWMRRAYDFHHTYDHIHGTTRRLRQADRHRRSLRGGTAHRVNGSSSTAFRQLYGRDFSELFQEDDMPLTIDLERPLWFWFLTNAVEYDLTAGLLQLEKTFLEDTEDELALDKSLLWALTAVAFAIIAICVAIFHVVFNNMRKQVRYAVTFLWTLPWVLTVDHELIARFFDPHYKEQEDNESSEGDSSPVSPQKNTNAEEVVAVKTEPFADLFAKAKLKDAMTGKKQAAE
ncbi:unnamed protein product [Vitrella brassicaformis CCMP3155]|uniref:TmcB/TmcC TPR repeats domain-containing protein n=4 Tax=Vitrella brassicaformis TaxID=1169539 RepID=A0A0G4ENW3_VITBC|nr:unnamed protein product [Vitrella brassicaformis CCMP3155]|eukprot:CEL99485.1 unnamed protein product [Vitrella brassicaformis CCMP3155]